MISLEVSRHFGMLTKEDWSMTKRTTVHVCWCGKASKTEQSRAEQSRAAQHNAFWLYLWISCLLCQSTLIKDFPQKHYCISFIFRNLYAKHFTIIGNPNCTSIGFPPEAIKSLKKSRSVYTDWKWNCFFDYLVSLPTVFSGSVVGHYLAFFCWECLCAEQMQRWVDVR